MPRVHIQSEAAAEPRAGPSDPMVLLKNPDIPFSFRSQVYSNVTESDEDSVDDPYKSPSQRDYTKRQIDPRLYSPPPSLPVEGLWDRIARMPLYLSNSPADLEEGREITVPRRTYPEADPDSNFRQGYRDYHDRRDTPGDRSMRPGIGFPLTKQNEDNRSRQRRPDDAPCLPPLHFGSAENENWMLSSPRAQPEIFITKI